jgi:glycosidase
MTEAELPALLQEQRWWKEAIIYQVYPRSFYDSNGDGLGDLNGITAKLDYIKGLGANLIWICPMYKSPCDDYGYDISDYYTVSETFGTNEDLYNLIAQAKRKGIGILLDLVINHSSDEHSWFQQALKDPKSKYRDYYFFRQGVNGPPNNWRSYLGGSAWEPVPGESNMYYLHAFSKKRPDLNWENQEMKQELYNMINWWISKGIAGFRIDAILNIKKTMLDGIAEPDGEDGLVGIYKSIINQSGIKQLLQELKDNTFTKHDIVTVAEAAVPDDELEDYIGPNGFFNMSFDFRAADIDIPETGEWYEPVEWTVNQFRDVFHTVQTQVQQVGWGATYFENHDQNRSINKYFRDGNVSDIKKKMLTTILLGFRGTPVIHEGQEIGMENIRLDTIDQYEDVNSHSQYRAGIAAGLDPKKVFDMVAYRSRDNSRTPMQWDVSENAGFTTGKPWLPVNPNFKAINVAAATEDKDSVYYHFQGLLKLRTSPRYKNVLVYGKTVPRYQDVDNVVAYERVVGGQAVLFLANFQNKTIELDGRVSGKVLSNNYQRFDIGTGRATLSPYQALVIDIST